MATFTNNSKSSAPTYTNSSKSSEPTYTNVSKGTGGKTWNDATEAWNDANYTWNSTASITWSNQSKS